VPEEEKIEQKPVVLRPPPGEHASYGVKIRSSLLSDRGRRSRHR